MTRPLLVAAGVSTLALVIGVFGGRYSMENGQAATAPPSQNPELVAQAEAQPAAGQLPQDASSAAVISRLTALEEALRSEIQARIKLERALDELRPASNRGLASKHAQTEPENLPDDGAARTQATTEPVEAPTVSRTEALAQLGVDATRVSQLQKKTEELEMQQLVLRDKASREGWINTPRYADTIRKMPDESDLYRKELGDANYDTYLFKTGQPNRVAVQSVLAGSPAQKVAIEAGDIIYSYADQRVFNWSDLTGATSSGEPGQTVRIELVRHGRKLSVYVPRGPLGVRMSTDSAPP